MTEFVLDNSVVMRWCFPETASDYSEKVLDDLLLGAEAHVPALWFYEAAAVLSRAQRAGTISAEAAHSFLEDIRELELRIDYDGFSRVFSDVYGLAVQHRLSAYDAAYLELAIRLGIPLATLDDDLVRAARQARAELYSG